MRSIFNGGLLGVQRLRSQQDILYHLNISALNIIYGKIKEYIATKVVLVTNAIQHKTTSM